MFLEWEKFGFIVIKSIMMLIVKRIWDKRCESWEILISYEIFGVEDWKLSLCVKLCNDFIKYEIENYWYAQCQEGSNPKNLI